MAAESKKEARTGFINLNFTSFPCKCNKQEKRACERERVRERERVVPTLRAGVPPLPGLNTRHKKVSTTAAEKGFSNLKKDEEFLPVAAGLDFTSPSQESEEEERACVRERGN